MFTIFVLNIIITIIIVRSITLIAIFSHMVWPVWRDCVFTFVQHFCFTQKLLTLFCLQAHQLIAIVQMPADLPPPPAYDEEEYVEDPSDLPPPYYEPAVAKQQPEVVTYEEDARTATAVSPDVARDALLRYIDQSQCCWGTGPAKECSIETNVWASIVCKMETFVEYRTTAYEYVSIYLCALMSSHFLAV